MARIAADLGPYPHSAMSLELKERSKRRTCSSATCAACHGIFRTTQAQIDLGPERRRVVPLLREASTTAIE